jgi:succinyl-diaminopimelate desuccinylase
MGGASYARAMDNVFAFGPVFPGRESTEHRKDEHLSVAELILITQIYAEAIKELAT